MSRKQKKTLLRIGLAALLLAGAALLPAEGLWKALAYAVPWLVIGWDVLWDALRGIAHGQVFDEKFLMAVATIGAFAIGEYPEAAAVMLFYQIGEWFQSIAVGRSRKSIAALMDIRPEFATVLRDGEESEVDPEEVALGETILIRPGERVPLDGVIIDKLCSVRKNRLIGLQPFCLLLRRDGILGNIVHSRKSQTGQQCNHAEPERRLQQLRAEGGVFASAFRSSLPEAEGQGNNVLVDQRGQKVSDNDRVAHRICRSCEHAKNAAQDSDEGSVDQLA